MILIREFHNTASVFGRFPALVTRISRRAHAKNLQKIAQLKLKIGDKYRAIGRENRRSPYTERRSPSKPSQLPKPIEPKVLLKEFLLSPTNPMPTQIKLQSIVETFKHAKRGEDAIAEKARVVTSLRVAAVDIREKVVESNSDTILQLPPNSIPLAQEDCLVEPVAVNGPFYRLRTTPSEVKFLLETTPQIIKDQNYGDVVSSQSEQAEALRRVLSMENSSAKQFTKFNVGRAIEIFQRHDMDTGSPEAQGLETLILVAAMTVKILAIKDHLSENKKDISTKRRLEALVSQRKSMLKYLKRKVLYILF